jgi:citrate lyase subunit beta/citryl-CoA lyase
MKLPRSKLFVPGNRPERMRKAAMLEADALSFDLEDAVPPDEKAAARSAVVAFLEEAPLRQQVWVRINPRESGRLVTDLLALAGVAIDVINVPKVEHPRDVHLVHDLIDYLEGLPGHRGAFAIVPTIETAAGLRNALAICQASPRVVALQLGTADLRKSTGIVATIEGLRPVRVMLTLAAAEVGVGMMDSAYTDIANPAGFEAEARDARALGFKGKSCIHPSQVSAANAIFLPTESEIAEARAIVEAFDAARARGIGAIQVGGKLVDGPIVDDARRVLAQAGAGIEGREAPGTRMDSD